MLQKDNRYRILELFFKDPAPTGIGFQLREISRKAGIAPASVKRYLNELEKEKLIFKSKHRIHSYPIYHPNRDNDYFKSLKKLHTIQTLKELGLVDYLHDKCMPDVIILFGSASRGEDLKDSDLDLFLSCKQKNVDLSKYEQQLNRRINIFFNENFDKLSKELKNNIINGIILKGYLKVF